MKKRLAMLTSGVFNPFLVSLVVLVIISFETTAGTADALKWSLILVMVSVLPVFSVVLYLAHKDKLEGIFINVRRQRNKIYLLATLCAGAGAVILIFGGAPRMLTATFVAGLAAIVVFMGINFWWKISLHTAFAAASVTVLTIVYGLSGALAVMLVPPVAWARIELEHHSPAQAAAGALLATVIVLAVFYLFALLGATTPSSRPAL
jgi:membrane-associated phospholipid phosphatase